MKIFKSILVAGLVIASASLTFAGDIYVIANKGLNMSQADVKEAYTGDKTVIDGVKLVLTDNKALQSDFIAKVLGTDLVKYSALWAKKSFREGLLYPKQKGSDGDVVDFVKSTAGAVGYVGSAPSGDVKLVGKF